LGIRHRLVVSERKHAIEQSLLVAFLRSLVLRAVRRCILLHWMATLDTGQPSPGAGRAAPLVAAADLAVWLLAVLPSRSAPAQSRHGPLPVLRLDRAVRRSQVL